MKKCFKSFGTFNDEIESNKTDTKDYKKSEPRVPLECNSCEQEFMNTVDFDNHNCSVYSSVSRETIFKCSYCNFNNFYSKVLLQQNQTLVFIYIMYVIKMLTKTSLFANFSS